MRLTLCVSILSSCALGLASPSPALANGLTSGQVAGLVQDALAAPPQPEPPVLNLRLSRDFFVPLEPLPHGAVPTRQARALQAQTPASPADFKPAPFTKMLQYSVQLIFYEHVMRVATQPFTRAELKGPFWKDYIRSVKMPKQWSDGDSWEVNYIGHPMHGSAGVRLWLAQREPQRGKKGYWGAMWRAALFGALFSEQFEIGPLSEASIGNVGLHEGRTGWVDHVITPAGSVLWTLYEDAADRYVLKFVEKHVPFVIAKAAARMILCPAWMLANVGMNRAPWDRDGRPITFSGR